MMFNTPGATIANMLFHEPIILDAPGIQLLNCRSWDVPPNDFLIELTPNANNCLIESYLGIGNPQSQRAGIKVHARGTLILGTQIRGIVRTPTFGFTDVQAIGGYAHTKGLRVSRSVFEASTECCMFGGADCPTEADIPEDIVFEECGFIKFPGWRGIPGAVKNIFELKNAKHVKVLRSFMEYSWVDAQVGFGIVLTPRNQDGANPWATIEDVEIKQVTMKHVAGAFNLLGTDYTHPSKRMTRVTLEDIIVEDLSSDWGGNQKTVQLVGGVDDLTLRRVTVSGKDIAICMTFDGDPCQRMRVEGCNFDEGLYGIHSPDTGLGVPTLEKYAPGLHWQGNTIRTRRAETGRVIPYPADTQIIPA